MEFMQILAKEILKKKLKTRKEIMKLRNKLCLKHKPKRLPSLAEILLWLPENKYEEYKKILQSKPTRTISGVAVVAIMAYPFKCPKDKPCIYCPGGPKSAFGDVPQSYTGGEPASMRAKRNFYDPYLQVFNRLEQYILLGHEIDKIELIVMGGTFLSFEKEYKEEFVLYALKAMNDFSEMFFCNNKFDFLKFKKFFELPGVVQNPERVKSIQSKLDKLKGKSSLLKEQKRNEKARVRCVALCIETRPDYGGLKEGNEMLDYGCTRVEIGLQSLDDNILKKVNREHSVKDSIKSIQVLKDLGFKVSVHYMPGLPGVSLKKDLEQMKKLFSDENFKPDMLKIYPCLVIKGTKLYDLWKKGKYKELNTENAAKLIAEFKQFVPEYCRIQRIQRDISDKTIIAGVNLTNLRQYVNEKNVNCKCIRCREIGRAKKVGKVKLIIREYDASKGKEFFISVEDKNNLIGFCRLRFPFEILRKEITDKSGIIRELHVYSPALSLGGKASDKEFQHRGYGKLLLKKAEEICRKNGMNKLVVISGIGVREYYKKLGYKKDEVYMSKKLK